MWLRAENAETIERTSRPPGGVWAWTTSRRSTSAKREETSPRKRYDHLRILPESRPPSPLPDHPLPIVSTPEPTNPQRPAAIWLIVGPLLLAATVRLIDLGKADLWLDEAMSYLFASLDLPNLVAQLRLDSGPPLYYLLLRGWMALFGSSEAALRTLSALFGVLTVLATYAVGRHAWGPSVGRRAALFLAVLPLPVFYAHQARTYTLLAFAGVMAVWGLIRWLDRGHLRDLVLVSSSLILALYSHNYALFLVPALAIPVLVTKPPDRPRWPALIALGTAALAYAPWALTVLQTQLANRTPTAWMGMVWGAHGVQGSLLGSLRALAPGAPQPPYIGLPAVAEAMPWTTLVMSILLLAGLVRLVRPARHGGTSQARRWLPVVLTSYAFLPLAAALAVSLMGSPVYLPGRLDQLVVPAMVIVLALGVELLPGAALRVMATGLVIVASLASLTITFFGPRTQGELPGDRAMATAIAASLAPGDAIVTTGLTRAPLAYNLRTREEPTFYSFPTEVENHLGNLDAETMLTDRPALVAEAQDLFDRIAQQPNWRGRIILVLVPDALGALLLETIREHPRPRRVQVLGDFQQSRLGVQARVFLLEERAPPSSFDRSNTRLRETTSP